MVDEGLRQGAIRELARRELVRRQGSVPQMITRNFGLAARDTVESAGVAANTAMFGIPGIASQLATGGRFTGQAYPMVKGGQNIFEGQDLSSGQRAEATGVGMIAPVGGLTKLGLVGLSKTPAGVFLKSRTNIVNELKKYEKQFGETIQGVKLPIKELASSIGKRVYETGDKLQEFKKNIDNSIFKEAEKSASAVHAKLPIFFRNASKSYGDRVDEIAQTADETGNITRQEAHDLVNNIKAEAVENQLDIGPVFNKVNKILEKYPTSIEDATQQVGYKDLSQETIPFKELNQQIREVMEKTSSAFKSGQRSTPEDIVAMITKEHYGKFLENKVSKEVSGSLKQLNESYKPIAQARKELGRIFKPYNQFSEGEGANFLSKAAESIAKRDLSEGKAKLLNLLEKGNDLTPGIGDVSSRIKALGDTKVTNEKQLNNLINDLKDKKDYVEKLQATRESMDNKIKVVLGVLGVSGLGSAGASMLYRSVRNVGSMERSIDSSQ